MSGRELIRLEVAADDDIVGLRQVAGRAARLLGLETADATRVATSVSELGRLAQQQLPITVRIGVTADAPGAPSSLVIAFTFTGPLPRALQTGQPVHTAIGRLMDRTELSTDRVVISKALPHGVDADLLVEVSNQLRADAPRDLRSMLQLQNDELLAALVALREREAELVQLNAELDSTNRGVVALYAELEQRAGEVRTAQRAVFEELERALRPPAPDLPGLDLEIRYLPAQANSPTGGDLYDWFVLPDGTLHITVVDVQGHGVTSTRDALLVTHAIRTLALEGHGLGKLLSRTDTLLQNSGAGVAATVLVARIDPTTGSVHLAGAGHPPALRIPRGATERLDYIEAPGRPLGYEDAGSGSVTSVMLQPGDCILLYTDGLIEIRRDVVEGLATLAEAAAAARALPLRQLLDDVLAACSQGDPLGDDTLLLAARRTGLTSSVGTPDLAQRPDRRKMDT